MNSANAHGHPDRHKISPDFKGVNMADLIQLKSARR